MQIAEMTEVFLWLKGSGQSVAWGVSPVRFFASLRMTGEGSREWGVGSREDSERL